MDFAITGDLATIARLACARAVSLGQRLVIIAREDGLFSFRPATEAVADASFGLRAVAFITPSGACQFGETC